MQIKNLQTTNNLFLAPMAGFTDPAFRMLCKKQDVALTFTEMISVNALSRNNQATIKMIDVELVPIDINVPSGFVRMVTMQPFRNLASRQRGPIH